MHRVCTLLCSAPTARVLMIAGPPRAITQGKVCYNIHYTSARRTTRPASPDGYFCGCATFGPSLCSTNCPRAVGRCLQMLATKFIPSALGQQQQEEQQRLAGTSGPLFSCFSDVPFLSPKILRKSVHFHPRTARHRVTSAPSELESRRW